MQKRPSRHIITFPGNEMPLPCYITDITHTVLYASLPHQNFTTHCTPAVMNRNDFRPTDGTFIILQS